MSLFRKPTKKIQRRVFACDDDEDGEPEPPPPPVISKKENKHVKAKLLSFADEVSDLISSDSGHEKAISKPSLSFIGEEEEDGEVFKVKKSSQSKRLAKKREKEKNKDSDNNCEKVTEVNTPTNQQNNDKPKKKVNLEGLILSGREALAADGTGDVEDEPDEEVDESGFHRYRAESVRAALATAEIPDAALIHAARKTRQQAREMGGGDYISIRSEPERKGPGSRLIRDDGSDDEEEGRIEVRGLELPSDKPKRGTMAVDQEELDSAGEEWEEQQIKKAVPTISDITGEAGVNPFSLPPPPPSMETPPHLRPLHPPPTSARQLSDALAHRLGELRTNREQTALRRSELCDRLLGATRRRDRCEAAKPTLEAAYRRAQGHRGYITDLIECLDEKMPELEALESRALTLYRRRCDAIQERRRQDVSDQALDVRTLTSRVAKQPDSEEKIRRTAEREGRRRARRLERDRLQRTNHREGDSSDDDLPPSEAHHYNAERDAIRVASSQLFSDALPRWRSVGGVAARLARWKSRDRDSYVDAYLPHFLTKLLAPYVRHQLILWNPFADEDNEDLEKMDWYKCLMMYGVKSSPVSESDSDLSPEEDPRDPRDPGDPRDPRDPGDPRDPRDPGDPRDPRLDEEEVRGDPDLYLVPNLVQKVVIPKLTEVISSCWDPMSVRSCVRIRGVVPRVCTSVCTRSPTLSSLSSALSSRLSDCISADVFLPPLPPTISEGPGGAFWRRCVGSGVRLLRGTLALTPPPPLLRADPLVLALIGTLCTAAAAAPPTLVASAAVDLASTLPRHPSQMRTDALRRLAKLAQHALNNLHSDNPLHLKALEQARSVLAEAKAAEES